jgi:diguanylate cyclase (GGDEF)-like protein/PAS domain S-box-containing protein
MLRAYPNAPITAVNETGFLVPMPSSIVLAGQKVIQGHATLLELVVPEDMKTLIETWVNAVEQGAAHGSVRLRNNPLQSVTLRYVDARHRHGVFVGMFEIEGDADLLCAFQEIEALRPRLATIRKNQTAVFLHTDEATSKLLGWTAEEMVGRRTLDFLDPDDHPRAISAWMDMLRAPGSSRRVRMRHRHKDGSWVWFEVTNHNLLNDPAHGYVLTELLDVTDEMAAHEALRAREHLLRRLTDALPLGVFHIDEHRRVVYRNARLRGLLGHPKAETVDRQFASTIPGDRDRLEQALSAVLVHGRDRDLEISVKRPRRGVLKCTVSLRALSNETGAVTGAVICVADITESARLREQLEDRATFDVLTRCHNRASILSILDQTLADESTFSNGRGAAVIFIDLDRFKELNDTLGHSAGDAYLVDVARRLRSAVRANDSVGRLGGDEFLAVCPGVESEAAAIQLTARLHQELESGRIQLGRRAVTPRVSVGVAWTNSPSTGGDALVAQADTAMYVVKRARRNQPLVDAA